MERLSPAARTLITTATRREGFPSEQQLERTHRSILRRAAGLAAGGAVVAASAPSLGAKAAIGASFWGAHLLPFAAAGAIAAGVVVAAVPLGRPTIAPVHSSAVSPRTDPPASASGPHIAALAATGTAADPLVPHAPWPSAAPTDHAPLASPPASPGRASMPSPSANPGRASMPSPSANPGRASMPSPSANPGRASMPSPSANPGRASMPSPPAPVDHAPATSAAATSFAHSPSPAATHSGVFPEGDLGGPRATPTGANLARQLEVLHAARLDLASGRPDRALRRLDADEPLFAGATFEEQSRIARVNALCNLGRAADARVEIAQILVRWPNTALRVRDTAGCVDPDSLTKGTAR